MACRLRKRRGTLIKWDMKLRLCLFSQRKGSVVKRVLVIASALALALALAGCGSASSSSSASASSAAASSASAGSAGSEQSAGLANPWHEAASAKEAATGAGVGSFMVPEPDTALACGKVFPWTFRYMQDIAEADGSAGAATLCVRKGVGIQGGDVSGDYNEYAHNWTQDVYGVQVLCHGNVEGASTKTIWTAGGYSYCVLAFGQGDDRETFGLSEEDVALFVSNTK